ncbi:glycosyltransferase [Christiangramia sp.]|uniref:glycosyltransferase n=1 Tax=Christiangramia sp. TaxID=1931228 RepID=UPI00261B2D58|nr:glycosyltransferase [Christiangramia sp.]
MIFGANEPVYEYIANSELQYWGNLEVYGNLGRGNVLKFMGESLIYIGNSISDGMPNTLLEALIMEVFPIQSNPGDATAEIIHHNLNGFLIQNPESISELESLIKKAIQNPEMLRNGIAYNKKNVKHKLQREYIREEVLEKYDYIQKNL